MLSNRFTLGVRWESPQSVIPSIFPDQHYGGSKNVIVAFNLQLGRPAVFRLCGGTR